MPIKHGFETKVITEDEFHTIDYKVMELAFSIQRDMGKLWNENIYRNELADRCRNAGFEKVDTELPINISYNDFQKDYYVDLVLNDSVIYELKAVRTLTGIHQQQALHYLFLLGMQHGKLVNMRPHSVEHRFVSTKLTIEKRFDFTIDERDWQELDEDSLWLKQLMFNLLTEWGAFLDTGLFYDAIYHFRGGEEHVVKETNVMNGSRLLGRQKVHLLNRGTALKISSMTKEVKYYEQHLFRFLQYTELRAIQWINFNHDRIEFKTVLR